MRDDAYACETYPRGTLHEMPCGCFPVECSCLRMDAQEADDSHQTCFESLLRYMELSGTT